MAISKLSELDYPTIIQAGLQPRTASPKKVLIIGAGMAGLVAAYELMRAGHEPFLLEAQTRVGGRIDTLREPFSDGLYGEAGAMRIPRCHRLTMAYVDKFGLAVMPFTMANEQAYCCFKGNRVRFADYSADPSVLDFPLSDAEQGKSISELWTRALAPCARILEANPESGWDEIEGQYDRYSVREFLEEANGWSEGAIEMFGLLYNQEALMNSSFLELLREETGN